jgi:ribosomal protein S18 acetylase RimI-like enzyme
VKTLYLEVRADNISAKRLYEKFAFRRIAVREKYYGGKYDAEIYKLRVGS